eukprot:TRINITY_DN4022_c0_g1_i1.p1 TRINITY_DN4022_c0_g1~~TRINITY_DN4022_c0_g1_i1.p1  ORF type:complete len:675 (-),score=77.27 TRINITY_DN4022_c0_g1_i1:638-2662(-)
MDPQNNACPLYTTICAFEEMPAGQLLLTEATDSLRQVFCSRAQQVWTTNLSFLDCLYPFAFSSLQNWTIGVVEKAAENTVERTSNFFQEAYWRGNTFNIRHIVGTLVLANATANNSCLVTEALKAGFQADQMQTFLCYMGISQAFKLAEVSWTACAKMCRAVGVQPEFPTGKYTKEGEKKRRVQLARLFIDTKPLIEGFNKSKKKAADARAKVNVQNHVVVDQKNLGEELDQAMKYLQRMEGSTKPREQVSRLLEACGGTKESVFAVLSAARNNCPERFTAITGVGGSYMVSRGEKTVLVDITPNELIAGFNLLTKLSRMELVAEDKDGSWRPQGNSVLVKAGLNTKKPGRVRSCLLAFLGAPIWMPKEVFTTWVEEDKDLVIANMFALMKMMAIQGNFDFKGGKSKLRWLPSIDAFNKWINSAHGKDYSAVHCSKNQEREEDDPKKARYIAAVFYDLDTEEFSAGVSVTRTSSPGLNFLNAGKIDSRSDLLPEFWVQEKAKKAINTLDSWFNNKASVHDQDAPAMAKAVREELPFFRNKKSGAAAAPVIEMVEPQIQVRRRTRAFCCRFSLSLLAQGGAGASTAEDDQVTLDQGLHVRKRSHLEALASFNGFFIQQSETDPQIALVRCSQLASLHLESLSNGKFQPETPEPAKAVPTPTPTAPQKRRGRVRKT